MSEELTGREPDPSDEAKTLYQVRVPVVFDHLNENLRRQLRQREVSFKQALGRGVAVVTEEGFEFGKFEVWFEVNRASSPVGRQQAADSAIGLVEEALCHIELAPTNDETGLSVVHNQVITTPLVGG
jgi:hypothetical protein